MLKENEENYNDTSMVIFSGNDHADFTHWDSVVKAVVGLPDFKCIDDFAWSTQVFDKKGDSAVWGLSLPDKGLMRDGGLLVLARLVAELHVVSTSITELDLRQFLYWVFYEIQTQNVRKWFLPKKTVSIAVAVHSALYFPLQPFGVFWP